MIEQQSAGIITFIQTDHEILYLVLHYLSGHWDFAKGKLELGETLVQAAQRELFEETGLPMPYFFPGLNNCLNTFLKSGETDRKNGNLSLQDAPIARQSNFHENMLVICGCLMRKRIKSLPIKMPKKFWL